MREKQLDNSVLRKATLLALNTAPLEFLLERRYYSTALKPRKQVAIK
jgi:hypothetical protein